ncbi:hypothetical protein [Photobacterium piscicola]|uniref:DUF4239 domain-containing protein n=1 Tax=Photobacterium piscicola TaxID=1378299 RepID=A0ABU6LD57_9GAMM|nr:hypothetical protein [Photobacterium piscicola]
MEQFFLEKLINSDSFITDIIMILFQLIIEMKSAGKTIYICIPIAILLSTAVVWLIRIIAKNINNEYEAGVGFAVGSFFSFITTFSAVLFLFSLHFTEPVVKLVVKGWEVSLMADTEWRNNTFREAYEKVADLKNKNGRQLENFTGYPHPDQGGNSIPTISEESRLVATNTYLIAAENNFNKKMPFLSWILTAKSGTAKSDILNDMKKHFATSHSSYLVEDAYKIASDRISKELLEQAGRIKIVGSIIFISIWLLIQLVIISFISWAALRNIKENF